MERVKQEMAKQGISPVNLAGAMFKIVLIAIFFSVDISYGDQRIAEERRTEEVCKTGKNSRSEGYLPIFEHNRGFTQKIRLSASTSGRDAGFAGLTQRRVTGDCRVVGEGGYTTIA